MTITIRMTEASNEVGVPGGEGHSQQRPWSLQFLSSPVQTSDWVHLKLTSFCLGLFFFLMPKLLYILEIPSVEQQDSPGSLCCSQLDCFLCLQSTLLSPHQDFDCGSSVCSPLQLLDLCQLFRKNAAQWPSHPRRSCNSRRAPHC